MLTPRDTDRFARSKNSFREMALQYVGASLAEHVAAKKSTISLKVRVRRILWSVVLLDMPLQLPIDSHAPDQTTLKRADCIIWQRVIVAPSQRVPWYVGPVWRWKNQPSLPIGREKAFERVAHLSDEAMQNIWRGKVEEERDDPVS